MLLKFARVVPWIVFISFESFGRVNVTSFPSMFILISEENSRVNSPLGPLTVMLFPSCLISTPAGRTTTLLPIRLT